jgi:predicted ester cyclase
MVAWWRAANHGGMTVTSNKQIAEELITALFTNGDLTAVDLYLDPDLVDHDRPLPDSPYWPEGMRQPGRVSATPYLVPAGTYRASVMGEPPIGRNVVFCGVKIFRIADGTIVERWRPERSSRCRARSQTCGSRARWR